MLSKKELMAVPNAPQQSSFMLINTVSVKNTNGTFVMPAGIAAGDLLLIASSAGDGGAATPTIALAYGIGFTALRGLSATYTISTSFYRVNSALSYKVAVGNESGTSISGFMNALDEIYVLFHVRGSNPIASITATAETTSVATSGDPPAYSMSTTSTTDTVLIYSAVAGSGVPTVTASPTVTNSITVTPNVVYGAINTGVWLSQAASTYSFNQNDAGPMNVPLMARLVLNY